GELPVDPPAEPIPGQLQCVSGMTQAAYRVQDGSRSGVVTVALLPDSEKPSTDAGAQARLRNGMKVVVQSKADDGGQAPYVEQLQEIAQGVADGL
ncbi:MAG: hypothetical protein ACRDQB_00525, partial [Thermocrispum sp.]